jgi:hypothetical protein
MSDRFPFVNVPLAEKDGTSARAWGAQSGDDVRSRAGGDAVSPAEGRVHALDAREPMTVHVES